MVNSDKYLTLIKTELCSGKRELGAFEPPPPFPKQQILDSFKLKVFADDSFKFDENGYKF